MYSCIVFLGFFFTVLSGSILAYLSVATMMGPWMAPTIALISNVLFKIKQRFFYTSPGSNQRATALIQAIGSVGGAVATGVGFAFPMLYFLDRAAFTNLLAHPVSFFLLVAGLCLTAGSLGISLGTLFAPQFIDKEKLPFPVSQLTYSVISAQNNRAQALGIFRGVSLTVMFSIIRDGIGKVGGIIPKTIHLFTPYLNQACAIALWPTIWAIGFSSGLSLVAPILLGLLSKHFILTPLNYHAHYLPFSFFQPMDIAPFTVAFCSGIVLCEVIWGISKTLKKLIHSSKKDLAKTKFVPQKIINKLWNTVTLIRNHNQEGYRFLNIGILLSCISLLAVLKFPIMAQIVFLAACTFATHQICLIGGKIGLIQFGRFSTYILVPMYLLFDLSYLQLTVVCVFFHICAATASDSLFDFQTGELAHIPRQKMWSMQWIGLLGVTLTLGAIFYLLFTNLHLGSPDFFAQRSQAKALLLQTLHFDPFVVLFGFIYGFIVKNFGFSPTMVFGGIIMPNSISIGLIIGASLTLLTPNKDRHLPFCAGVFASESLWVIISILIKIL